MTALLASVRSSAEALDAAHAGAELIDLKEPGAGALGGVAVDEIARIVRRAACALSGEADQRDDRRPADRCLRRDRRARDRSERRRASIT